MIDEDELTEELEEDEYVPDQVCPWCGSRLRVIREAGLIYCTSMVCGYAVKE